MPKYCLPIIRTDKTSVMTSITDSLADYTYFEVWLDYVANVDEAFVQQLVKLLQGKLIILFRRQNLEPITMEFQRRVNILNTLSNTSVFVDLDVTTQAAELQHIHEHNLTVNTILSYHNYQNTPGPVQLTEIIDIMKGYQPTVYKLATYCKNQEDGLWLMQLLLRLKARGLRVIILGMGEQGTITRIFGTLWGNEMTFAPLSHAEQSAPGQLTKSQLETIFKEIGRKDYGR